MINQQEVLKYINLARQYPKYYVALVEEQLNAFMDKKNLKLHPEIIYQTMEGKQAWIEARQFLMTQTPLRPFENHSGLLSAASDHVKDIVKTNNTGHQGSDGSSFIDRIQRYCRKGKGSMIELLGTTYLADDKNSIELALLNLIIDDGVPNRGHRKALFNEEYRHIGAAFSLTQDKIYSVIAMSQANLQILKEVPHNIATSTSHLQSTHHFSNQVAETSEVSVKPSRQNSLIEPQRDTESTKNRRSVVSPQNQVWTLKNVTNSQQKGLSKKSIASKQSIPAASMQPQPSIFNQFQIPPQTPKSKASISNQQIPDQRPVRDHKQNRISKKLQSSHAKDSSIKSSQNSIKSEPRQKKPSSASNTFGLSSNVQQFKAKSSLNSPFLKTHNSAFGSTSGSKKVVEKKETMRTWNQDEYLVKEITTVVKYEDGSMEDWVEKHSVLKGSVLLNQGSI